MALEQRVRPIHLRPAAELAERVLLPGDPHRALAVAQALLEGPRMFNHARGLWGYTGRAADGGLLTVQATGIGGPSAAVVTEELISLGARRLVRIGTCGALGEELRSGDLVAAEAVIPADGTSAALGAGSLLRPDPGLMSALVDAGARPTTVVSTDLFFDPRSVADLGWGERGAHAVEMEAAAIMQVAALRSAAAACLLAVTDVPGAGGAERVERAELETLGVRLGEVGYAAMAGRDGG
jgi:uridine phosphorylase